MIDDEDFEKVSSYKLYFEGYVRRNDWNVKEKKGRLIYLHKELMGSPDLQVDHIDRNPLNNQKDNLRICTASENCQNRIRDLNFKSSKYHGVYRKKGLRNKSWCASIRVKKKLLHIGYFLTEEDAAKAYDLMSKKYFGEFAIINLHQSR